MSKKKSTRLVDRYGAALNRADHMQPSARPMASIGDSTTDALWNYGMYEAVNYSPNRAARPYFATDSKSTLTSWSRIRAMALARWAYINVHFVKGAVDLNARLTMGTGFSPTSHCKDSGLARAYDEYYAEKTQNIGFMNRESMSDLSIHDSRCVDVDGDVGYVMVEDEWGNPRLQLIEAHRIKNGDVTDTSCIGGVWTDSYGRPTHYNVLLPGDSKTTKIPVQNFIYLAEHNRPDEVRSMTNLIHALNPLQDLYEILGFAMTSAKKNTEIGTVITTPTPNDPPIGPNFEQIMRAAQGGNVAQKDQSTADTDLTQPGIPQQRVAYEQIYAGGGKVVILRPGEKMESFAHSQPAPEIEAWAKFIIRGIAVGFGRPFEVLWDPESIGGANTRMITALLRQRDTQRREQLVYPKLTRTRFWILSKGIKRGELKYSPDILNCSWAANFTDITVDVGRERRERRADVQTGLDTYTNFYAENGGNYQTQELPEREKEIGMQCEAAQRLCAKFPGLSFRDALIRIAMLTPNANEIRNEVETDPSPAPTPKKK